jgi:hypothetical protein
MRRGLTAKIILDVEEGGMERVHYWFHHFVTQMEKKIQNSDPNAARSLVSFSMLQF